jgi:hypothetical protein
MRKDIEERSFGLTRDNVKHVNHLVHNMAPLQLVNSSSEQGIRITCQSMIDTIPDARNDLDIIQKTMEDLHQKWTRASQRKKQEEIYDLTWQI